MSQESDDLLDFESLHTDDVETVAVSAERDQIKRLMRIDYEVFMDFFIHEQLTSDIPEFHGEIWSLLTDAEKERILLAIPRGHNKTTLAKLAVAHHFIYTNHRFCVYLSNTNGIAKNACKDILGYFESDNFQNVFGKMKLIKSSETDSLWIFEITDWKGRVKQCMLKAVGADQQVRGLNIDNERPDLAVVDDVEDNKNTETPTQQKKLDRYIFGPFLKAMSKKRRKVMWLGNMLQKTSLLARLSRNASWNPVVFGAIIKDKVTGALRPLWPELWTLEQLQEDFKEHKDLGLVESWMCEMMNMPGHGENGFTAEQMNYLPTPTPEELEACWITIDPAFGENNWNDNTAIVVHGIPKETGIPMVCSYSVGKFDEVTIFTEALQLSLYWGARVWGIESVAAQRVLLKLFDMLLAGRMLTGQFMMVPLMAGKGDSKISRIRAWVSLMVSGDYGIPDDDMMITAQAMAYNMKKSSNDDDLLDSCAYGPQLWHLYEPLIREMFNGGAMFTGSTQYGMEVAGV